MPKSIFCGIEKWHSSYLFLQYRMYPKDDAMGIIIINIAYSFNLFPSYCNKRNAVRNFKIDSVIWIIDTNNMFSCAISAALNGAINIEIKQLIVKQWRIKNASFIFSTGTLKKFFNRKKPMISIKSTIIIAVVKWSIMEWEKIRFTNGSSFFPYALDKKRCVVVDIERFKTINIANMPAIRLNMPKSISPKASKTHRAEKSVTIAVNI